MADAQVLEVEGPDGPRQVRLSSPDRVMWPDAGITKGDLAAYVVAVGDPLVHHIGDRPVTLQRFPDGIEGEEFYQKNPPKGHARLGAHRLVPLPERAPARPARRRRGGERRVGRADEHRDLPPVAGAHREQRQPRRAAHRPRPAAGAHLPGRRRGGPGAARADGRDRAHRVRQDQRQPRRARLRAGRAHPRVPRRAARRHRHRPRARAPAARPRHHVVVEGGARRAHLRRLQPGLPRPHHRLGLQPAPAARRAGVDAGHLGRAAPR